MSRDLPVAERIDSSEDARAAVFGLPVPEDLDGPLVIPGVDCDVEPLAWRPTASASEPWWWLVCAVGDSPLPQRAILTTPDDGNTAVLPVGAVEVTRRVVAERKRGIVMRETGEVLIHGPEADLALRLGLDTGEAVHWWEWVTLERRFRTPVASAWRAAGYAPVSLETDEDLRPNETGYRWEGLHVHNWLFCELDLLVFAGGVVRVHARHVNNRFFDRGRDLEGCRPVVGVACEGKDSAWRDVTETELDVGGARLNLADAAGLSSPEQPARIRHAEDALVWQPYAGVEIFGGVPEKESDGAVTPIVGVDDGRIPRGVARTVRFVASVGAAPPLVSRYRLPAWWHARCGSLGTGGCLPSSGVLSGYVRSGADWLRENMLRNSFDEGAVGRSRRRTKTGRVAESGWEGETPFALMQAWYLFGDADIFEDAIRDVYNVADVATDHADMHVRMHGQTMDARSLPMQRVLGHLAGWLETGDPYLLETARAVADAAYWWDRSNWPRRSVGRDAAYVRGLTALARVTGERCLLERAREALHRFASVRREDGSFSDQGGTVGVHGTVNEVVKPWMNSIMMEAMLDFLAVEDDALLEECVLGVADWLVAAAFEREDDNGVSYVTWAYKYRHGENESAPYNPEIVYPQGGKGVKVNLYRALLHAAVTRRDAAYLEPVLRNLDCTSESEGGGIDQGANKRIENGILVDAVLFGANWEAGALRLRPAPLLEGRAVAGRVETPVGVLGVRLLREGDALLVTLDAPVDYPVRILWNDAEIDLPAGERDIRVG